MPFVTKITIKQKIVKSSSFFSSSFFKEKIIATATETIETAFNTVKFSPIVNQYKKGKIIPPSIRNNEYTERFAFDKILAPNTEQIITSIAYSSAIVNENHVNSTFPLFSTNKNGIVARQEIALKIIE